MWVRPSAVTAISPVRQERRALEGQLAGSYIEYSVRDAWLLCGGRVEMIDDPRNMELLGVGR